jgi:acetyltransferase-like isoleucine patch superfamily enzyme
MSPIDQLILKIKRAETPTTRLLHDAYRSLQAWNVPETEAVRRLYGSIYYAHDAWTAMTEYLGGKLLYEPMLRARCHHVGARLRLTGLPYLSGHARISIGDDCALGPFTVLSGRFCDQPELTIGDHCTVGTGAYFSVSKRIRIGNHVSIAKHVSISDGDGHPTDLERRMRDEPLAAEDLGEITIEDYAWIGRDAHVLKGVTIGRGAIVATGSVVASDVPPNSMAMGVPARIIKKS